jgi:hypothetical protein
MSVQTNVTFVTAFFDIYGTNSLNKPNSMRFEHFKKIASTQIPIVVFTDESGKEAIEEIRKISNLKIVYENFQDLQTVKEGKRHATDLPETRCMKKDTEDFMLLMHAKVEFLYKAIQANPFGSEIFAWMDFSLSYVFRNMDDSLKFLQMLSKQRFVKEPFLAIPGCWPRSTGIDHIWNAIHWRFCGGFFIGHAKKLQEFYTLYRDTFSNIIGAKQRMIWETNIWTLLEEHYGWRPDWFQADHNDSILHIPSKWFCEIDQQTISSNSYTPPFVWPLQ